MVGKVSIQSDYNLLKINGDSSSKSSKSKKLKSMIKDYSNDFSIGEIYRMIGEVYKKVKINLEFKLYKFTTSSSFFSSIQNQNLHFLSTLRF